MINNYNIINKYFKSSELCSCISENYFHWDIFSYYKQSCVNSFTQKILDEQPNSILILYISYSDSIFLKKLYYTYTYRCQYNFTVPEGIKNLKSDRQHAILFRDFLVSEYIREAVENDKLISFNEELFIRNPIYVYNNVKCANTNFVATCLHKNVVIVPDFLS